MSTTTGHRWAARHLPHLARLQPIHAGIYPHAESRDEIASHRWIGTTGTTGVTSVAATCAAWRWLLVQRAAIGHILISVEFGGVSK